MLIARLAHEYPTPVTPFAAVEADVESGVSVTVSVVVSEPVAAGVNVTEMLQLLEAARVLPQVVDSEKAEGLAPPKPMELIVAVAVPVLDSTKVCAADCVLTL